ncbi:ABC transporter G family member 41-like [Lolium rigidum]|uniref:ABC transporter G family member 41-like n=1 Tax=Lolium rigidum TaxID=89674 RepID=UPI001F5DDB98|nr:ABC transporter G family member 41-like [Lolium rigidum]
MSSKVVEMGEAEQEEIVDHESEKKEAASAASRLQLSSSSLREALSSTSSLSRLSLSLSLREQHHDEEVELKWAAIERLPTMDRLHTSLPLHAAKANAADGGARRLEPVDVRSLGAAERRELVHALIADIHKDNLRLLRHQRRRMDSVGVRQPTVEVRWRNVRVEAECQVVDGKPLPTLLNSAVSTLSVIPCKRNQERIQILKDVTGILKPSRMTLLLGPPGCGKTSLLLALAGKLNRNLKVTGEIEYNGVKLQDFVPEKTAAYIGQYDLHVPEMTVRETLDFSARFQGVGSRAEIMKEVIRREKEAGISPDPDIDTYMKAISVEGLGRSMQTDYIMKIMGLDICADVLVGDAMRRGISGGEKKRLTTGEMIVGPSKALFMDEISTGLDSSTTFQIVTCLQQLAHISESTILVSLLQPAPETYDLFDDIILMAEGQIVYHGSKNYIMSFFESCGFKCPERKGCADFLQEVLSKKDQHQYWSSEEKYKFFTVEQFCDKFKASQSGQNLAEELSMPCDESKGHKNALSFSIYSLSKWDLLKACFARELLLMKRNSFLYISKTIQLGLLGVITGTVFLRTRMGVDRVHANYYMGSLFYALVLLMVNGFPELAMALNRLPVFYKQRDYYFYPAWAYAIPSFILKIPVSLVESVVWTSISYYLIGYTPEASRFFCQLLVLFLIHTASLSMFRCVASYGQTMVAGSVGGTLAFLVLLSFGGFLIPRPFLPNWLKWGFWLSPLSYAEIGLTGNEFLASRWLESTVSGVTLGRRILMDRGLDFSSYFYWISVGAMIGFILLFNVGFAIGLTIKNRTSRAIISRNKPNTLDGRGQDISKDTKNGMPKLQAETALTPNRTGRMEMREHGYMERKLQLLHNITGAFQPGVLSALMGVTGAGKTTLLDVLAGRKTGGVIEGDIRIGGYPKIQETFARISGYCEQTDVHSPQITVGESVAYSAWLRLPPEIDSKTRNEFVNEVLETIELDEIRDSLVGVPGVNGLSTEQRKRLTIAVELVSNPSIIFMDEPTSGLDARAAAIVMRAVKNVADTGRTVVCTIHQPSIEIFEAFDELMLMKRGGELIYAGPLGHLSCEVIRYFQASSDGDPGVVVSSVERPAKQSVYLCVKGEERVFSLHSDLWSGDHQILPAENLALELTFTPAELDEVLLSMRPDSAPGPDGLPVTFFKRFWGILREPILKILNDFVLGRVDIARLNFGVITLIPKVKGADTIKQFRPIALINVIFKFVEKACLHEGVLALHEIAHELHAKRLGGLLLKLDFEKAYDRVNWDFLREILQRKGFSDMNVHRLMQLVMGGQTAINVNGEVGPFFHNARGVRQGDPLSPIMFDFLVDGLAAMLAKANSAGHIRGVVSHLIPGGVTHLQYADDTLVMIEPSDLGIANLKFLLLCFENMSGLKINFDKSEVFVTGVTEPEQRRVAHMLNCKLGKLPMKYLGIPRKD